MNGYVEIAMPISPQFCKTSIARIISCALQAMPLSIFVFTDAHLMDVATRRDVDLFLGDNCDNMLGADPRSAIFIFQTNQCLNEVVQVFEQERNLKTREEISMEKVRHWIRSCLLEKEGDRRNFLAERVEQGVMALVPFLPIEREQLLRCLLAEIGNREAYLKTAGKVASLKASKEVLEYGISTRTAFARSYVMGCKKLDAIVNEAIASIEGLHTLFPNGTYMHSLDHVVLSVNSQNGIYNAQYFGADGKRKK